MRALVLSGGGSHGAWQAGAIKALCEKYQYDVVVGTSVGSVNAVGLSTSGPVGLVTFWQEINGTKDVMCFNWCWPWNFSGIYRFDPLKKLLRSRLQGKHQTIPAYVASLCLEDSTVHYDLATGDIDHDVDLMAGSCAISGIQVPTNGRIDGGHKEQAPVRFAVEVLKANVVDVVLCDPQADAKPGWKPWRYFPILSIMLRALEAMIDEIGRTDVSEYAQVPNLSVYRPANPISISSLSYDRKSLLSLIDDGYNEIKGALP